MELEVQPKRKGLFLWLSSTSLILLMAMTTGLWYFISPRLHEYNEVLPFTLLIILRIFFLILVIGTLLIIFTAISEKNLLIAKFAVKLSIQVTFPLSIVLGKVLHISKSKIRESFVWVSNSFINALNNLYSPEEILILLPHCLQNTECNIRINVNIQNCRRCGKCDIADLLKIVDDYGVKIAIATGGTLARRIIMEMRPKFIIAVACDRDMVSGIRDVFPIQVYGVLNQRPQGPCINTRVPVQAIRDILDRVVIKKDKSE